MSLSYVHRYHAGNFADIHKHLALIAILEALHKKPTAFSVLDAFAGEGLYALSSDESLQNKEFESGIGHIMKVGNSGLPLVDALLKILSTCPRNAYPGSPYIIAHYLRQQDKAHFIEKHPTAFQNLSQQFKKNKACHTHQRDAYEALKALIPFRTGRGLVLLDPSYEVKTEYESIVDILGATYQRFSQGIYILWYPVLQQASYHIHLKSKLAQLSVKNLWVTEWTPFQDKAARGMVGSGLAVINLPWECDRAIIEDFKQLNQTIYPNGSVTEQWIHRS